jgi:four helix bundle protein
LRNELSPISAIALAFSCRNNFIAGTFGSTVSSGNWKDRLGMAVALCNCMAGWRDFTEIGAWQRARELKLKVDELLARPEFSRRYKFSDQLGDAARSGQRNIAEGFGRFGNKEFAQFARIAKASQVETLNHLIDALDQKLLTDEEFQQLEHQARIALKATVGLIRHLETTKGPTAKGKPEPGTRNP